MRWCFRFRNHSGANEPNGGRTETLRTLYNYNNIIQSHDDDRRRRHSFVNYEKTLYCIRRRFEVPKPTHTHKNHHTEYQPTSHTLKLVQSLYKIDLPRDVATLQEHWTRQPAERRNHMNTIYTKQDTH